jgi:hypothetical protein
VKDGRRVPTDRPKIYELVWVGRVEPEAHATLPHAYLIPPTYAEAIDTLRRHGVAVKELREDIVLDVVAQDVTAVEKAARPFQKHTLATVEAKPRAERRMVPAGTAVVETDQPGGRLAAYLLLRYRR